MAENPSMATEGIAIVGMAGRFPMAPDVGAFWRNLAEGKDCFSEFPVRDLIAMGLPRGVAESPDYVRRCPVIDDPAAFDARAFGYSPREAELIDPQHRIMMECSWEALEYAGYDPRRFDGSIGIWAGCGVGNYFLKNLLSLPEHFESLSSFQTIIGNDKDYLASRIAYKLDLRGPAVVVQTACSTSLVAVHMACQALLTYQCDMALAGGVSLQFPRARGYLYSEGEIFSPDGFCRPFDKRANGTVLGEGCGVVLLRRLEDSLASGDTILAVIRGSAVNNDGGNRVGFTAPGADGQSEVVAMALAAAGVRAEDIGYIEAHGTGTALGDPIEVSSLTRAFRQTTQERGFCGLGSVKSSIGHLDVAAGAAGLIKTICALQHRKLPPSLHFIEPNPELKLSESPFFVVDRLMDWRPRNGSRLAGISSFGLGGTNAHVVIQEFQAGRRSVAPSAGWRVLPVSAATETAVIRSCENLAEHLRAGGDEAELPDLCYTLTVGRQELRHRRCVVASTAKDAEARLRNPDKLFCAEGTAIRHETPVVFMFSGQGTQYPRMAQDLYRGNAVFRESLDACARSIGSIGGSDSLLDIIFDPNGGKESLLNRTEISQPALFSVEYSLCRLWESMGVKPSAVVGHSSGEYAAACEAGMIRLADALRLIRERGRLMQSMEPGAMIAVSMSEAEVREILPASLDIAVINAPTISEISGPTDEVRAFTELLRQRDIPFRYLHTSHAFHSRMMEKAVQPFAGAARAVAFSVPRIPFASNLTGDWLKDDEAVDPSYWPRHLRATVRFSEDLDVIARRFENAVLLEVGPGNTACSISRQQAEPASRMTAIPSIRHPQQKIDDAAFFARALGALWCNGVPVDLPRLSAGGGRRILIPGYPFERRTLLIQPEIRAVKAADQRPKKTAGEPRKRDRSRRRDREPITLEALIEIWEKVLGAEHIGPDDNFFDLGGHSLLAVGLANRIGKAFGRKLPLAALLDSPTPRRNFRLLCEPGPHADSRLCIPVMALGTRTPFFLFHSHGGNVLEYYRLATLIGEDRPIYALQCRGADGSPLMEDSIEEMAARYLEEIRAIQPEGPYLLGGYCFGGILAVEAALQLEASGRETAIVVMINSVTRDYPRNTLPSISRLKKISGRITDRMALEWSNLAGKPFREKLKRIGARVGRTISLAAAGAEKTADSLLSALGCGFGKHSLTYHLEKLAENNDDAWLRYPPKRYAGKVLFFRAARQPRELSPDPMLGWKDFLVGKTTAYNIEGFRQNMLDEPAVGVIAKSISAELDSIGR